MSDYQDDSIYGTGGGGGSGGPAEKPSGLHKDAPQGKQAFGLPPVVENRFFNHSRVEARIKPVTWHVSKDDRASAGQVRELITRVEQSFGIKGDDHAGLEAFWEAVFFYHTVNSGSTAQPGRSTITIGNTEHSYDSVLLVLGVDQRRFFRALANEVRDVNKKVIAEGGQRNIEKRERLEWLLQVASDRGLSRYPELAHDSADACWGLDPAQRAALANSKMAVLSRVDNFVDSTSSNARMRNGGGTVNHNPAVGRGQYE